MCKLYADDLKLSGSWPNDALTSVHIDNHVVQCVDTVKDLGVHVDKNLKFMIHINKTGDIYLIHKSFISQDPTTQQQKLLTQTFVQY